jgi:transposase
LEKHAGFFLALIEGEPDLTLDEVVSVMRKHKVLGSRTAVWRFFQRHKIGSKKRCARRSRNARMWREQGGAGCENRADQATLVFIDESVLQSSGRSST